LDTFSLTGWLYLVKKRGQKRGGGGGGGLGRSNGVRRMRATALGRIRVHPGIGECVMFIMMIKGSAVCIHGCHLGIRIKNQSTFGVSMIMNHMMSLRWTKSKYIRKGIGVNSIE